MLDGSKYIECSCGADEHTLRFIMDKSPEYPCIFVSVFLEDRGFWRRLVQGTKYIFGHKSIYGHWTCSELDDVKVKELRDICVDFLTREHE